MIYVIFIPIFYILNYTYIKIWKTRSNKTPTGVGIFLIIPFSYFALISNQGFLYFSLLLLFSIIYFFDDLITINFVWRVFFQIIAPIIIFISYYPFNIFFIIFYILIFFILINTLNFQDGEDLNIAILLSIVFLVFYIYTNYSVIKNISLLILFYLLAFSFFNAKKKNLYLGDVGCFISSILILSFILLDNQNIVLLKMLLAVIFFPLADVFLVAFYRIYKKENLLTRNYYHIYQIFSKKLKFRLYLLPNIFMSIINSCITLNSFFNHNLFFVLICVNVFACIFLRLIGNKFSTQNEN